MKKKLLTLLVLCLSFSYYSFAQCTAEILQTGIVNVCQNGTLTLNASPGGAAYQWMENGINIPGATSDFYDVPTTTSAFYNYTVAITFNACTDVSDITSVYVVQQPIVAASSNSAVCLGATLNLTATTIPGASYSWTGPNSFTTSLQNPTLPATTLANAGLYQVVATVNGCASAPATTNVIVNQIPVATPTNNGPLCEGQTLNLNVTSNLTGPATYSWTGPGAFFSTQQSPSMPNVQLGNAGAYFVQITQNGCLSNAASVNLVVNPLPAVPVLSSNAPLCEGETLNLSASNMNTGVTYQWTGPGGYTNNTTGTPSIPNVTTVDAGTYTLTLSNMGCLSQGDIYVQVNPIPAPPTVVSPLTLCQFGVVSLTASGSNLLWYTTAVGGIGVTSLAPNTQTPGVVTYYVSQTVNGCESERTPLSVITILCDDVWPGDVNWDLVADNNDVLDLGLVYGQTGPVRTGASLNWVAQTSAAWGSTQVSGADMKHADCDGNGTVDATDVDAVNQNYGMTHLKGTHAPQAKSAALPDLYFDLAGITFQAGTTVDIPIKLGTTALPMNDILGIAAQVKITNVSLDNAPAINNNISWLGNSANTIHFTKDISTSQVDWAYVRTNHTNVSGEGTIATLSMEIPADAPAQDAILYFENVRIINSAGDDLTDYNVVDDTATIIPVSVTAATAAANKMAIVPNPSDAHANLQITLLQTADLHVTVTDMTGRTVWNTNYAADKGVHNIALPAHLASGIYTIQANNARGLVMPAMKWVKK